MIDEGARFPLGEAGRRRLGRALAFPWVPPLVVSHGET
jgi:hypothetical protein